MLNRIFLSADIEGTCGIAHWAETELGKPDYEPFRRQMTREVAAACEGAFAAGCEDLLIKDAHDSARNLIPAELPERVSIFRGWGSDIHSMMSGIDASFSGAIFTGYHSSSNTDASPLCHTMNLDNVSIRINGIQASELVINTFAAALYDVPVLLVTGDLGVCEQATHSGDAPKVLELAHKYPWVYAAVGIHPESLLAPENCGEEGPAPTVSVYGGDWAAEMRALAPCYEDPKVVAVGECGLDYHWPVPKDAQLALFEAELRLSLELGKPIIVHDRSAHADVYALLKKYRPKGIVHCYSGSADDAVWLAQQGLYIGFGGACTFQGAKRAAKAIAALPLEAIVLETDCPYMAPEPVRGTRCDSSLIRYVGEYIAAVKGVEPETVFRVTAENAKRVYQL